MPSRARIPRYNAGARASTPGRARAGPLPAELSRPRGSLYTMVGVVEP